jgi:hypothetical protein
MVCGRGSNHTAAFDAPPEAIANETAAGLLASVQPQYREAAIELLHWAVGAGGGAMFGVLPAAARTRPLIGAAYGGEHTRYGSSSAATAPACTAECTARAIRAPHSDRGPVKSSGWPAAGAAMQIASEAVPVARNPASSTAWVLADSRPASGWPCFKVGHGDGRQPRGELDLMCI